MKKILAFSLFAMILFAFAGCGGDTTTTATTASTAAGTTTTGTGTTTTGTGTTTTGTGTTSSAAVTTTETHDPVTVTYAAWNLGEAGTAGAQTNLERAMLEAFAVAYPWITVEIVERPKVTDPSGTTEIDQNWNEFLGARAAVGTLPDVYFTDSAETVIMNNWTKDVTALAEADPEFMNISADIRNAANYGGKIMALPYAVYYFGYFINKSLFDAAFVDAPTFTDSWEDFVEKVSYVANQGDINGNGIAGICGVDRILEWYPAQLNETLGWYTYDGSLLHLDGAEFASALSLYQTLMTDKTLVYDAMTPEEQLAAFGTTDAWGSNKLAAYWNFTPVIGSMVGLGFDVDFIGTPGTNAAHQIPVILDLMCVSSQTQHPAEAYLLAKWMSFGKAGYLKRIELSGLEDGEGVKIYTALNMTPLQPDEDLLDAFFALYPTFVEFRNVVAYGNYILEPNKYVPGYIKARWTADFDATNTVGDVFDKVRGGAMNYADVKTEWNTIANDALTRARTAVFTKLGVTGN